MDTLTVIDVYERKKLFSFFIIYYIKRNDLYICKIHFNSFGWGLWKFRGEKDLRLGSKQMDK